MPEQFYVTLCVEAESLSEADDIACGISDTVQYPIEAVYPDFATELDNDGQVVIYSGYIHPSHGS